jgi:hypothetical protein
MILPPDFTMEKYGLFARFVNEDDAGFIIKLRTNPNLGKFIHDTDSSCEKQLEWIRNYKVRERKGEDYYFIFYKEEERVGLYRLYGIHDTTFTSGSWVFSPDASFECCIAASIMLRELAFEQMGMELEDGWDGVHVNNKKVIKFNKMIGLKETGRFMDVKGEYLTMQMTKDDFEKNKPKLLKYIGF